MAKFPFPSLVLPQLQGQTDQKDPALLPGEQPRRQNPSPGRCAHRCCWAGWNRGLLTSAGAPPGAKVAGSTQGFCSEEKAPSKGKETNKERKKRLISRHRLAPCRTPSQNPVISLPLAPRSPGCCRQASSHLTCHQAKCRLSTNHRGSIAAGKAERPEIRLPGRAGRSWGLSTGHRCTPRPPLRADPAPDTHRAAPSAHRTPRPRGDVPARTPHVLPPAPFGKSRPFLCPPAHPSAGRDSQRAAQYPN